MKTGSALQRVFHTLMVAAIVVLLLWSPILDWHQVIRST